MLGVLSKYKFAHSSIRDQWVVQQDNCDLIYTPILMELYACIQLWNIGHFDLTLHIPSPTKTGPR